MKNLDKWLEEAKAIHEDSRYTQQGKNERLALIMTEMECEYQIPMLKKESWEKKNPEVLHTYRLISDMRKL